MGRESQGRTLFETMERLDPDGVTWAELSDHDREFYNLTMERVLECLGYVTTRKNAGNHMVDRASQTGE